MNLAAGGKPIIIIQMLNKKTRSAIAAVSASSGGVGVIAANVIGDGMHAHGFDARFHLVIGAALACGALMGLAAAALAYFRQSN